MLAIMLLIVIYLTITILTGILLYLISKYMREKPFGSQFVTDHLSTDLAITVFVATALTSSMVIAREILGPLDEISVKILLMLQQGPMLQNFLPLYLHKETIRRRVY